MKKAHSFLVWGVLLICILGSSCGKFIGNLRRDLDDSDPVSKEFEAPAEPTVGGAWPERGALREEPEQYPNHYDRSPGSSFSASPQDLDRYQRDQSREFPGISSRSVSNVEPEVKRQYRPINKRVTRDDFVDRSQEEGSLWASSGQTNYYFTKNKVRSPGDLVSVVIENDLYRDIGIEVKSALSPNEKAKEVEAIQEKNRAKFMADFMASRKDALSTSAAAPDRTSPPPTTPTPTSPDGTPDAQASPSPTPTATPVSVLPPMPTPEEIDRMVPKASLDDVDIYPTLELKTGDTMMGEIIERYPNGNYKVRTLKRIPYKRGAPRLVSVIGIVKASDIKEETDVINSSKLYEYRVEVAH